MVSKKYVEKQLKRVNFKPNGWGKGEINELPNIILPDEQIYEAVNGIYDGGFALLVATDIRVLLIDQKPMNYLTVEDLRFDMISEMDYSHRLFGARISISSGNKNLKFLSYNQPRLRKLIGHVQHCMAEAKKKQSDHGESQVEHLEKINEQLQEYLLEQQRQQTKIQEQIAASVAGKEGNQDINLPAPVQPSDELKDYLFAQSLLAQHQSQTPLPQPVIQQQEQPVAMPQVAQRPPEPVQKPAPVQSDTDDLYQEGLKEIFGKHMPSMPSVSKSSLPHLPNLPHLSNTREVNAINIAYSKLPMALRNRQFGRGGNINDVPSQSVSGQQPSTAL
jgi:hypothetical protein